MTTKSFTLGDNVPPTAVISASSNAVDDFGVDITPTGWPDKVTAAFVEVDLTVTGETLSDGDIRLAVSSPGELTAVDGVTDPAGGEWSSTGVNGLAAAWPTTSIEAYYLEDVTDWLTEYIVPDPLPTGGVSNVMKSTTNQSPSANGWDVRVKARSSDWSSDSGFFTYENLGFGILEFAFFITATDVTFRNAVPDETSDRSFAVPKTSFSLTNNEWTWFRVTYNGSTRTMWQSSDGSSWTSISSESFNNWKLEAAPYFEIGYITPWDGDLAEILVYDGNGTLVHDLALREMGSSLDTAWSTEASDVVKPSASRPAVVGSVPPESVTVRLDFAGRPWNERWRLIIRCDVGALTVDEVRLGHSQGTWVGYVGV